MDEFYQSEEFQELLERYEQSVKEQRQAYFEASELGDIIQYYTSQGHNDKAMEAADMALTLHPGAVEPLAFKARYAITMDGDLDEAERLADLVADKSDREYSYLKAEIMIQKDQIECMDAYLSDLYNEVDEDEADDFALDVAEMLNDYCLTELTLSWLNKVKNRQNPDYKSIKAKALVYSDFGDYGGEGENLLEQLTNDDPYNVEYWLALADAQRIKGEYKECIDTCDYAIAITPKDGAAVFIKGQALIAMERYDEAMELFLHYHDTLDRNLRGMMSVALAFCMMAMKREDEAHEWLDKAVEEFERKQDVFTICYLTIAGGTDTKGFYPLVKHLFETYGVEGNHFWAHMAMLSFESGYMDDYQYYLEQAIHRCPEEAQSILGVLFPEGSQMEAWPFLTPQLPKNG